MMGLVEKCETPPVAHTFDVYDVMCMVLVLSIVNLILTMITFGFVLVMK